MPNIWMDEARYVTEEEEQIVQLPGTALRDDNTHYDALTQKGALKCRFCDASVHFHAGSKSICGDNLVGPSAHFHTNRGQQHAADCGWPARMQARAAESKYNDAKGYKIHLNTTGYPAQFNERAGQVYDRGDDKKIITLDKDLVDRRPRSVADIRDMIDLMKPSDAARLRDSVVVHHDHVLPWDKFFVRYNRKEGGQQGRFIDLVERLRTRKIQPCMMEFNLASGVWPKDLFSRERKGARSAPIEAGYDAGGRRVVIQPTAWLDNPDNTLVSRGMSEAGRYLVMGYARLKTVEQPGLVTHYVNISVEDPKQLARLDVASLAPKSA